MSFCSRIPEAHGVDLRSVLQRFSPLSIGGETDGSMLTPGRRNSLYALKLTVGNFAADGIYRLTKTSDSGGMAKCSADLTILTRILLSTSPANHASQDLKNVHKMQFKGLHDRIRGYRSLETA